MPTKRKNATHCMVRNLELRKLKYQLRAVGDKMFYIKP